MSLGKAQLLQWATSVSGLNQITKYDDLKDGLVFVALLRNLFPLHIDASVVRSQQTGHRNPPINWEIIRNVMEETGLPMHICDKKGISAGHQKPCYNMLVMLYFLTKLSTTNEFAVDFAHPIDDSLAAFLQSPSSLECLARQHATRGNVGRSVSPAHPASSPTRRPTPPPAPIPRERGDNRTGGSGNSTNNVPLTWSDSSLGHRGEIVVARLKEEAACLHRQLRLAEKEIQHVRRVGQLTLTTQRALVESEMARASEHFQTQLTMVKLEEHFEAEKTIQRCLDDLNRTLEEIAIERDASMYMDNLDPRHELGQLRQLRVALESKSKALDEKFKQKEAIQIVLEKQVKDQAAAAEKLHEATRLAIEQLASESININVSIENATNAENLAVRSKIAELRNEIEALRASDQRKAEEIGRLTEEVNSRRDGGGNAQSDFEREAETKRLASQVQRLKAANEFLNEKLRLQARGKADAEVVKDFHAESTSDGIIVPSSFVGAATATDVSGEAYRSVAVLEAALPREEFEQLRRAFWRMASLVATMQARLEASTDSIRAVHEKNAQLAQQAVVEKFHLEQQLNDATNAAERDAERARAEFSRTTVQLQLELQLSQEELQRCRKELSLAQARLKTSTSSLLGEAEMQQSQLKDRNTQLIRVVEVFKQRDAVWQQLREAWTARASSSHERHAIDSRIAGLVNQIGILAVPSDAISRSTTQTDTNKLATAVQHQYETALEQLRSLEQDLAREHELVRQTKVELQQTKNDRDKEQLELRQVRDELRSVRKELSEMALDRQAIRSQLETERAMWQNSREEIQNFATKVTHESMLEERGFPHEATAPSLFESTTLPKKGTDQRGSGIIPRTVSFGPPEGSGTPPSQSLEATQGSSHSIPWLSSNLKPVQISAPAASTPLVPSHSPPQLSSKRQPSSLDATAYRQDNNKTAAAAAQPSSILTPEELEKRKKEILAKYGIGKP